MTMSDRFEPQDGDESSTVFELVSRHEVYDSARRYARRVLGRLTCQAYRATHEEMSHDIVQEVIRRALACRSRFRPDGRGLPWLRTITRSVIYDELRRGKRRLATISMNGEAETIPGIEFSREVPDTRVAAIKSASDRLKPEFREVLRLRYTEGLNGIRLAQAMGLATAKQATEVLYRAKRSLRVELGLE